MLHVKYTTLSKFFAKLPFLTQSSLKNSVIRNYANNFVILLQHTFLKIFLKKGKRCFFIKNYFINNDHYLLTSGCSALLKIIHCSFFIKKTQRAKTVSYFNYNLHFSQKLMFAPTKKLKLLVTKHLSNSQFSLLFFGNNLFINNLFYISLGLGIGILLSYLTSWLAKEIKKNSSNNFITTPPNEAFSEPKENIENKEVYLESLPIALSENPLKFNLKAFLEAEEEYIAVDVKIHVVKYILSADENDILEEFIPMLEKWCFEQQTEEYISDERRLLLIECELKCMGLKFYYKNIKSKNDFK
jgi:hypothetical protein